MKKNAMIFFKAYIGSFVNCYSNKNLQINFNIFGFNHSRSYFSIYYHLKSLQLNYNLYNIMLGNPGRMVVGFTTTSAISVYHH